MLNYTIDGMADDDKISTFKYNIDKTSVRIESEESEEKPQNKIIPNMPIQVHFMDGGLDIILVKYSNDEIDLLKLFTDIQPDNRY